MFGGPMTQESAERTAQGLFWGGFLFLPWLWFANVALFWDARDESDVVRRWVHRSATAFTVGCLLFAGFLALLYTVGQDWPFWIIKPNGDFDQKGLFSNVF
eukprot:GGOE01053195.1.p2 GENE.GGOE01053195.1~~GGOE01053195.1.p2  ORF type:complete len:101 (-),score=36.79 GGOE01053195.1:332-634(-)